MLFCYGCLENATKNLCFDLMFMSRLHFPLYHFQFVQKFENENTSRHHDMTTSTVGRTLEWPVSWQYVHGDHQIQNSQMPKNCFWRKFNTRFFPQCQHQNHIRVIDCLQFSAIKSSFNQYLFFQNISESKWESVSTWVNTDSFWLWCTVVFLLW